MYLSRVQLRREATASSLWESLRGDYDVHRLVWSWFADSPDRRRDFLYRHEGEGARTRFFTLSARPPVDSTGLWNIETKSFEPKLRPGDRLGFLVRVNPTRCRPAASGKGTRHDVVMDAKFRARAEGREVPPEAVLAQEHGLKWLAVRAARSGFAVENEGARVELYTPLRFRRRKGERDVSISIMDLAGVLTVTDPVVFSAAVSTGIGPAKGFGCGLMLLRRA